MRGDGSGRRSPGGVFFFLARQRLPRDVRAAIFNDKKPREPRPAGAAPPEPKPKSSAAAAPPPSSSSGLPRRRVFEVVPASKPAPTASQPGAGVGAGNVQAAPVRQEPRGDWPPAPPEGAYIPPELPSAVARAKAKQAAHEAIASLNPADQYLILLELVAELHAQFGGEVPRSAAVEVPRSERKPTGLSQPPPEPEEREEAEEPKPRATRTKAARPKAASAKTRSRG
jgi:hypothetical protein